MHKISKIKKINLVSLEKGKWWKCANQVVVGFTDGCGIKTFGRAFKSSRFRGHLFVCKDTESFNNGSLWIERRPCLYMYNGPQQTDTYQTL